LIPGTDIAGVLETSGSATSGLKPGDAIFGATNGSFTGGYAQYAVASLASIARKPASLSFVEAASVPVVAVTAWQMLFDQADVAEGQTVLVQGASGNVGAYAVQLARRAGARVIAVAAQSDAAYLQDLGAAQVIDFQTKRFEDEVSHVDAVIDTVGGEVQERSFAVLKPNGMLVSSVSAPDPSLAKRFGVRVAFFIVSVPSPQLKRIARLIDEGTLKTDVGVVLGLVDARKAHEMLAGKLPHPRGKIVLDTTTLGGAP
jgi:NADPH:quinone reductase-like Zn-dependent oxidoreductase